jgi:glycosyltransferase involved in cell wall biosynthesis
MILIVTNYWRGSPGGGVKNYIVNLANELVNSQLDVKVVFREGQDDQQIKVSYNRFIFPFLAFYKIIRMRRVDVIHSHGSWYCLLVGVLYKKRFKCKLIHTFHTVPTGKLPLFFKLIFQSMLNSCNHVTFVSQALKGELENKWGVGFENPVVTRAGVRTLPVTDLEIFEFKNKYLINDDSIVLLAQALTAHPLKAEGLKLLIMALKEVLDKYPNVILIATRKGIHQKQLEIFTKQLGLEDKVIFTGDIENPFVPLNICDIFTHISLGDGLPLAILEAMSVGKPIIATAVGGIPEAIKNGQNGVLVQPDIHEIAKKIIFFIESPQLAAKYGANAKKTVEISFNWEQAVSNFLNIYNK